MAVKAVLFDLDGTLVEFKIDYENMKKEVFKFLVENGVPKELIGRRLSKTINRVLEWRGYSDEAFKLVEEAFKIMERFELEAAEKVEVKEGVEEILEELERDGLKIVIVTNNGSKGAYKTLRESGLIRFVDRVYTRDYLKIMKPNSKLMRLILEELKLNPSEVILVGDSSIDVEAASVIGVPAIMISSSEEKRRELEEAGAKIILDDIRELPRVIEKIGGMSERGIKE